MSNSNNSGNMPKYIYERRITIGDGGLNPQFVNQLKTEVLEQVIPYIDFDQPLITYKCHTTAFQYNNRYYIVTGNVKLGFKGRIRYQNPISKTTFELMRRSIASRLQTSGNTMLLEVKTKCDFKLSNLKESTCTATLGNNQYISTSVSINNGAPFIDISASDQGVGSSSIEFSPTAPNFITFYFDGKDIDCIQGNCIIQGHLNIELDLTCTPVTGGKLVPGYVSSALASLSLLEHQASAIISNANGQLHSTGRYLLQQGNKLTIILTTVIMGFIFMVQPEMVLAETVIGAS